jgi:hypothetical protein
VVASVHPTRQQLDELDALLQRMLELPVNQVEETASTSAPPVEPQSTPMPRLVRSVAPAAGPVSLPSRPQAEAAEETAPAQKGMEPRIIPARQAPETTPAASLPVQPPHLFRKRFQTSAEEADNSESGDPTSTVDSEKKGEDWVPLRSSWTPSPHTWPPLAESWHQAQQTGPERPIMRRDEAVTAELASPHRGQQALPPDASAPPAGIPAAQTRQLEPSPRARGEEQRPETIIYPRPVFPVAQPSPSAPNGIVEPKVSVPVDSSAPQEATAKTPWLLRPLVWLTCAFNLLIAVAGPPGRWLTGSAGRTLLGAVGIVCLVGAIGLLVADWLGWTW